MRILRAARVGMGAAGRTTAAAYCWGTPGRRVPQNSTHLSRRKYRRQTSSPMSRCGSRGRCRARVSPVESDIFLTNLYSLQGRHPFFFICFALVTAAARVINDNRTNGCAEDGSLFSLSVEYRLPIGETQRLFTY